MEISGNQPSWDAWVRQANQTAGNQPLKVSQSGAVVQAAPTNKAENLQTLRDLGQALSSKFGHQKGTALFDRFFGSHAELNLPVRAQEIRALERVKSGFDETNKAPKEYFKTTNAYWSGPSGSVRKAKADIQASLKSSKSSFSQTLAKLDRDTRRELGIALLSGNGVQIAKTLLKSGAFDRFKSKPDFDSLKRLAEHDSLKDTKFLNTTGTEAGSRVGPVRRGSPAGASRDDHFCPRSVPRNS